MQEASSFRVMAQLVRLLLQSLRRAGMCSVGKIAARTERIASPGEYQRANLRIPCRIFHRLTQLRMQLGRERIEPLGTIQGQNQHAAITLTQQWRCGRCALWQFCTRSHDCCPPLRMWAPACA